MRHFKFTHLLIPLFILISIYLYISYYGWHVFFQQLINGIQKGSMYALIALGYTLVYGIIKLINFAHGEIFMVGAYISYFAGNFAILHQLRFGIILAFLASMVGCGILAVVIERVAYKPLRGKPRLTMLITALGVSLFLQNFLALSPKITPFPLNYIVFGPEFRPFPPLLEEKNYYLANIVVNNIKLFTFVIAILVMLILEYIVKYTRIGKAMRATSYNIDVAKMMGIDVDHIIMMTFLIGGALAGIAGTLYGLTYRVLQSPYLGFWPGIVAFVSAVVGGIGNIRGAMVGGFLMGIIETLAISINSNLAFAVTFLILIFVLLFRPTGLFGTPYAEKV